MSRQVKAIANKEALYVKNPKGTNHGRERELNIISQRAQ